MLQLRGFEVDVTEPARDYDVILLDLKMPVFDGERLATTGLPLARSCSAGSSF